MNIDIMAYNGTIRDYEVLDEKNTKVNYVNGSSIILEDSRKEIDHDLQEQVSYLVRHRSNLKQAFNYKGCASVWFISGVLSTISCIGTGEITVFCVLSWLNVLMQTLTCYINCRQIGSNVYPIYPSLLKAKREIEKYKLYLENEYSINDYLARLGESNLEQNAFDGTLNGVQKLTFKQMKKIVEEAKK